MSSERNKPHIFITKKPAVISMNTPLICDICKTDLDFCTRCGGIGYCDRCKKCQECFLKRERDMDRRADARDSR